MNTTVEHEPQALTVLPKSMLPTVLAADKDDLLSKLAEKVKGFRGDVSTPGGRDAMRSLAAEVARTKGSLLRLADSVSEEARKTHKAIVAEKKIIEERLDELRDQVRAPLTEYENRERNRVAEHEAALARLAVSPEMQHASSAELAEAIAARREPEARNWQEFHERAIAAHAQAIRQLSEWRCAAEEREAEQAELARLREAEAQRQREEAARLQAEREARIAAEAAERAQLEAEAKAKAEAARQAEAAAKREREANEAAERAQRAAEAVEQRRKDEAAAAERRQAEAVAAERRRAEQAAEAERQRVAREAEAKRQADERRAKDKAHRADVNRSALAALVLAGLSEGAAKSAVEAIALGKVPHVTITY